MVDIVVTAGSVVASTQAKTAEGVAGATITAGQVVYRDPSDNRVKLADNDASATTANTLGIALHGAASGQPIKWAESDPDFTPGATLVTGTVYVLSSTAGGIAPVADLGAGDYPVVLMIAKSTTKAVLAQVKGGAAI